MPLNLADLATDQYEPDEPATVPFVPLDLVALAGQQPQPTRFVVPDLVPAAEVTLFTGAGSAGKSLLGQQLATAVAAGVSMLGWSLAQGPAIYLTCEDGPDQLHWRQAHICQALGVPMASLAGKLQLFSRRGELGNELAAPGERGLLQPTATFEQVAKLVRAARPALVVLDNVGHLFAGNENDRGEVTAFVNLLNRLAGDTGAAVLLVGHPNKSGDGYSGSTAWLNAVRSQLLLTHDQDTDERLLMSCKANYSRNGTEVRFHWHEWAFLRSDDLAPSARDQYAEIGRANVENEAFLRCLRVRNDQGVERGVGPSPGPNYAPSQFERMSEARGIEKKALAKAMERLFGLGVISTQVVDRPGKSDKKTIIVEVK